MTTCTNLVQERDKYASASQIIRYRQSTHAFEGASSPPHLRECADTALGCVHEGEGEPDPADEDSHWHQRVADQPAAPGV